MRPVTTVNADARPTRTLLVALIKYYGWSRLVFGAFLQCLLWYCVTHGTVERPILGEYHVVLWPVTALVCPVLVPSGFAFLRRADTALNWIRVRPLAWGQWIALNTVLGLSAVGQPNGLQYWRNQLLCMGAAALLTARIPFIAATIAPIGAAMVVWLFGSSALDPPPWSLLMYPAGSTWVAIVAIGMFCVGTGALLRRPVGVVYSDASGTN